MVQRSENNNNNGNSIVVTSNNAGVLNENQSYNNSNINHNNNGSNNTSATYLYYLMSNAMKATNGVNNHHHDADSIDSGTCSEDTSPIPPPLPKKMGKSTKVLLNGNVTAVVENVRNVHFSDSEESESSLSSIGSSSHNPSISSNPRVRFSLSYLPLPDSLLKDIRTTNTILRKATSSSSHDESHESNEVKNETGKITIKLQDITLTNGEYKPQSILKKTNNDYEHNIKPHVYEDDKFYNFHLNERDNTPETEEDVDETESHHDTDETFAGLKEIQSGSSTIRSAKGTVRGVRNRVRNGIATFLKIQQHVTKVCFFFIFFINNTYVQIPFK